MNLSFIKAQVSTPQGDQSVREFPTPKVEIHAVEEKGHPCCAEKAQAANNNYNDNQYDDHGGKSTRVCPTLLRHALLLLFIGH